MKFNKNDLENLEIDEMTDIDLDEDFIPGQKLEKSKLKNVNSNDVEIINEKIPKKTSETLKKDENIKTIVIDKDAKTNKNSNSLNKFTKNRSKSFRFFD